MIMHPLGAALLTLISLAASASAATMTLNTTFSGSVRLATDPPAVNLFSNGTGTVSFANTPSPEFTGNFAVGGVPVLIEADFHGFFHTVSFSVSLVNSTDAASIPSLVFSFSGLQFTPLSAIVSGSFLGGTPSTFGPIVVTGPDSFTMTTNQQFLSNGGSYGGAFNLNLNEVPEPSTTLLFSAGLLLGLAAVARRRRSTTGSQESSRTA
jgi:hypothetical protein